MKKIKYLLVLVIVVICSTGCGKKSPEKILEDALNKMSKVNTFHSSTRMEAGSELYSQVIKIEGDYAINSSHEKMVVTLAGNSGEREIYTVKKDDEWYSYSNENAKGWYYSKEKVEDNRLTSIDKLSTNYKSVTKVTSEKKDYTKLEVVLDNSKAKDVLGESGSMEGMDPTKDVIMNVYIKDGYIALIKMDLLNTLTEDYAKDITRYSMSIEWSHYNDIEEIEVPEEILENAKLKEEEE